jgi:hypothetical protein
MVIITELTIKERMMELIKPRRSPLNSACTRGKRVTLGLVNAISALNRSRRKLYNSNVLVVKFGLSTTYTYTLRSTPPLNTNAVLFLQSAI